MVCARAARGGNRSKETCWESTHTRHRYPSKIRSNLLVLYRLSAPRVTITNSISGARERAGLARPFGCLLIITEGGVVVHPKKLEMEKEVRGGGSGGGFFGIRFQSPTIRLTPQATGDYHDTTPDLP